MSDVDQEVLARPDVRQWFIDMTREAFVHRLFVVISVMMAVVFVPKLFFADTFLYTDIITLKPNPAVMEAMRPNPLAPEAAVPTFIATLSSMRTRTRNPWPQTRRQPPCRMIVSSFHRPAG